MFAGLFTEICLLKKAAAAIVNAVSIFRRLNKVRLKNNKETPLLTLIPKYLKKFNG
jgi:hypothetical protein